MTTARMLTEAIGLSFGLSVSKVVGGIYGINPLCTEERVSLNTHGIHSEVHRVFTSFLRESIVFATVDVRVGTC